MLSTPGISPVQGAPKKHAQIALFLMAAASFHRIARNEPAGIATDPADGLPVWTAMGVLVALWQLARPNDQDPPISIIKKAAETFRNQHRRKSHTCQVCISRDLPT